MNPTELNLEERTARVREESAFVARSERIEGTIVGQREMLASSRRLPRGRALAPRGRSRSGQDTRGQTVADSLEASANQFTPDLLPADLRTLIFDPRAGFPLGPIFTQFSCRRDQPGSGQSAERALRRWGF
jgi:hypothetical protein